MLSLKSALMQNLNILEEEATQEIIEAKKELNQKIESGEMPFDFCQEKWGLEPDYLDFLLY